MLCSYDVAGFTGIHPTNCKPIASKARIQTCTEDGFLLHSFYLHLGVIMACSVSSSSSNLSHFPVIRVNLYLFENKHVAVYLHCYTRFQTTTRATFEQWKWMVIVGISEVEITSWLVWLSECFFVWIDSFTSFTASNDQISLKLYVVFDIFLTVIWRTVIHT